LQKDCLARYAGLGEAILSVVRKDWLTTSTSENVVAVGIYATMFSVAVFTLEDIWILFTGKLASLLHGPSGWWALLWAALATMFSAISVFVWRPVVPRIVMTLFSMSMASHILEQFVAFSAQQLKLAALCRISVAVALVGLVWRVRPTHSSPVSPG
jgi:hypothetical protein